MLDTKKPFSKRLGYSTNEAEITIREDAPNYLREFIISQGLKENIPINTLLRIVCDILHEATERNWGYDYIEREVYALISDCSWYKVYDIAEEIYHYLGGNGLNSNQYAEKFNNLCFEKGVGWHFQNGLIVSRGTQIEEKILTLLSKQLNENFHPSAKNELEEAFRDISRRPMLDLTGSIQHAFAALECVANKITSSEKSTLGEIIKKHPTLFPKPLDQAVEKIWGYASQKARHVEEGNAPSFQEATLMIGLASSLIAYLNKFPQKEYNDKLNIDSFSSQ